MALTILLVIIVVSNFPPIYYFIGESYSYQNKDGSFVFTEQSSTIQNFEMAELRFENFKIRNPQNHNDILFRKFKLKPWKFWEWWNMFKNSEKYKLQYFN